MGKFVPGDLEASVRVQCASEMLPIGYTVVSPFVVQRDPFVDGFFSEGWVAAIEFVKSKGVPVMFSDDVEIA